MLHQKENSTAGPNIGAGKRSAHVGTPTKPRTRNVARSPVPKAGRDRPSTPTGGNRQKSTNKSSPQPSESRPRMDMEQLRALTAVREVRKDEPVRTYSSTTDVQHSLRALKDAHTKRGAHDRQQGARKGMTFSEKEVDSLLKKVHSLEVALINTQEDSLQYQKEYEKIKEEGCALYDAYMVKVNSLKDLQTRFDGVNRERELAQLDAQKARIELEEQELLVSEWQLKCSGQAEKFKESFRKYKLLKEENSKLKSELGEKEEELKSVKATRHSLSFDMGAPEHESPARASAATHTMLAEFETKEAQLQSEIENLTETVESQRTLLDDFEIQVEGGQEQLDEEKDKAQKLSKEVKRKKKAIKKYQKQFQSLTEDLIAAQQVALAYSPSMSPVESQLDTSLENCSFGSNTSKEDFAADDCAPVYRRHARTSASSDLSASFDEDESSIVSDGDSWLEEDADVSMDDLATDSDIGSAFNFDDEAPVSSTPEPRARRDAKDNGWLVERTALLEEVEQLKESLKAIEEEKEALADAHAELQAAADASGDATDTEAVAAELAEQKAKFQALERDMLLVSKKHKSDLEQLGQSDSDYRIRYERILQEHQAMEERASCVDELQADIVRFQEHVTELCELLEDNTGLLLEKEASIRVLQAQSADSATLSQQVAELQDNLDSTEEERAKMQQMYEEAQEKLDALSSEKSQFLQDLQHLNSNLSDTSSAKTELGQLCQDLQAANATLEAKLTEQSARHLRTTEQLEKEAKALQHYNDKYLELADRYDSQLSAIRQRDSDNSQLRAEKQQLASQAEQCVAEAARLNQQVEQLTAICEEYESKIADLSQKQAAQAATVEEYSRKVKAHEADTRELRSDAKSAKQEAERLRDDLARQQEINEFLSSERDMMSQHMEESEQELEEVQDRLAMLEVQQTHSKESTDKQQRRVQDKILQAEVQAEQLSGELSAVRQKAEASARAHEQELAAARAELATVKDELEETAQKIAAAADGEAEAKERVDELQQCVEDLESKQTELLEQVESLTASLKTKEEESAAVTGTLAKLHARKTELKEKLHRAMRQGSELQAEYEKLVNTNKVDAQHLATIEASYQEALKNVDAVRIHANEELVRMSKWVGEMEREVQAHLIELGVAQHEKEELQLQLEMLFIVCEEQELMSAETASLLKRNGELEQQTSSLSIKLQAEEQCKELLLKQIDELATEITEVQEKASEKEEALAAAKNDSEMLEEVLSSVRVIIEEHASELETTGAKGLCMLLGQGAAA